MLGIDIKQYPPSSKAGARFISEQLINKSGGISRRNDPLLWEYCAGFWNWDTSEYIRGKIERGQRIGRSHVQNSFYRIIEYVKPRTLNVYLSEITAQKLDALQLRLRKELPKMSGKSINMIMMAINTPLREAYRLRQIQHNPAHSFRSLANNSKKTGILTAGEIIKLFDIPWETEAQKMATATAAATGARLGEVMALAVDDLDVDFQGLPVLWIRKSFSFIEGMKETKTGNIRVVPISAALRDGLLRLAGENPHGDGLIFWGLEPGKPLTSRIIEWGFYRQLKKIGITEKERRARNIKFHSLRHGFNSTLRGAVPDGTLRLATGHKTAQMTDHYDHLTDTRLSDIRAAQEKNILIFKVG
jgi:integrase